MSLCTAKYPEPLLWPWPWKQQSNLFTRHQGVWWCTSNWSNQIWLQKDQKFKTYSRKSYFDYMSPVTLKIATKFCLAWHSSLWWCITIPCLVTKGSTVQRISYRQTLITKFNIHGVLDLSKPIFSLNTLDYVMMLYIKHGLFAK